MIHLRHYCLPSENKKTEERKKKEIRHNKKCTIQIHSHIIRFLPFSCCLFASLSLSSFEVSLKTERREN